MEKGTQPMEEQKLCAFSILFLLEHDLVEDLFAFFDDDVTLFEIRYSAGFRNVRDLYIVYGNAALLHEAPALAL